MTLLIKQVARARWALATGAAVLLSPACGDDSSRAPAGGSTTTGGRASGGTAGAGGTGGAGSGGVDASTSGGSGGAGNGGVTGRGNTDASDAGDGGAGGADDSGTDTGAAGDGGADAGGADAGPDVGGADAGPADSGRVDAAGGSGGSAGAPAALDQHVHIYVSNTCVMRVDPLEVTVPARSTVRIDWHNHSSDYPVDVWLSYGGGYVGLPTGSTWDEPIEHCANINPYTAYADISTACSRFRFYIRCL